MEEKEFLDLKRRYLLDENGSIRSGIDSMAHYIRILEADDEDEFDRIIKEYLEREDEVATEFFITDEEPESDEDE